jgi:Uncharacterized protein conserved in bacteria
LRKWWRISIFLLR